MKHLFNFVIFIIVILLVYYLIQYIQALSKSVKKPYIIPPPNKIEESSNMIIPNVKYTRAMPTIYNTTNMFQYI
jgi:hypothetical protein|tara:strand:+ start:1016 stop:1237 length:222 start_codon:yes stop_codon:yes gene_type:complete